MRVLFTFGALSKQKAEQNAKRNAKTECEIECESYPTRDLVGGTVKIAVSNVNKTSQNQNIRETSKCFHHLNGRRLFVRLFVTVSNRRLLDCCKEVLVVCSIFGCRKPLMFNLLVQNGLLEVPRRGHWSPVDA